MTEEIALSVNGLRKTFRIGFFRKKVVAVRDSTFSVRRGEVFGLVGHNGAGKTTTIKMLMGLIAPDGGEAHIFGESIRTTAARRRVGFLPETPNFYDYLKPAEILDYYGRLYGMDARSRAKRIPLLLDRVGLSHAVDKRLRKFSKGMLQRIGLAQALLPDPDLVLLDEPQSGLDPLGRKDVRDLIIELREQGKTVMFSSHILHDVEAVCDRVAIITRGLVRQTGRLDELVADRPDMIDIVLAGGDAALTARLVDDWGADATPDGRISLRVARDEDSAEILALAINAGVRVERVERHRPDLEALFVSETERVDEGESA
jgi:ABC-2 type transport system ATP-binding protein